MLRGSDQFFEATVSNDQRARGVLETVRNLFNQSGETDQVRSVSCEARIDTGADVTLVPDEVVKQLELELSGVVPVRDYDANQSFEATYRAYVHVGDWSERELNVVETARPHALIGWDYLSHLTLVVYGS